ncbi:hypothetical protein DFP72DRAFT_852890 [Ephemerocybe angulata]|uniref:Uncharacterized protein n=1 Tax=Ephemerocybe angulata TaxID=980116 RepID=A0A8H6HM93_9AGAR|nr:hypothetical protein DFP72DRAFT_852890 [Tulosesus angulatus]
MSKGVPYTIIFGGFKRLFVKPYHSAGQTMLTTIWRDIPHLTNFRWQYSEDHEGYHFTLRRIERLRDVAVSAFSDDNIIRFNQEYMHSANILQQCHNVDPIPDGGVELIDESGFRMAINPIVAVSKDKSRMISSSSMYYICTGVYQGSHLRYRSKEGLDVYSYAERDRVRSFWCRNGIWLHRDGSLTSHELGCEVIPVRCLYAGEGEAEHGTSEPAHCTVSGNLEYSIQGGVLAYMSEAGGAMVVLSAGAYSHK